MPTCQIHSLPLFCKYPIKIKLYILNKNLQKIHLTFHQIVTKNLKAKNQSSYQLSFINNFINIYIFYI